MQDRCVNVSCSRSLAAAQKTVTAGEVGVVQSRHGSFSILTVSAMVGRSNANAQYITQSRREQVGARDGQGQMMSTVGAMM